MRLFRRDRGAALVESAIVLPIVLLILFGMFEFGRFIVTASLVTNASREAARYATATGPGTTAGPRYADCDGMRDAAQEFSVFGVPTNGQVLLEYDEGPGTGVFQNCASGTIDPSLIDAGDRIVATVSVPFATIVPLIDGLLNPTTISITTTRTINK